MLHRCDRVAPVDRPVARRQPHPDPALLHVLASEPSLELDRDHAFHTLTGDAVVHAGVLGPVIRRRARTPRTVAHRRAADRVGGGSERGTGAAVAMAGASVNMAASAAATTLRCFVSVLLIVFGLLVGLGLALDRAAGVGSGPAESAR